MKRKGFETLFNGICMIVVAVFFMAAIPTPAPAAPAKPIEFKVYYHGAPRGGQSQFYQGWIQKIEKATEGRVKMTWYPGAVLGPPMEAYEMIKSGAVEMGCIVQGFYPGRFLATNVVRLPFLGLPSGEIGSRIFWELYEKFPALKADYPGVKVLILYTDAPTPIGTKKPVRKAEDIKGMKIRSLAGSPTEMLKELGAVPVLMPPHDVYSAMERGVIDGWMISWEGGGGFRYQDVTNYFLTANMYQPALAFLMNLKAWDSLPPDIQKIFNEHTGAAGAKLFGTQFDHFNNEVKNEVKGMKGKEIIQLPPNEVARWKKISRPVWDRWIADMKAKGLPGQALADEAERLLEKYTKK